MINADHSICFTGHMPDHLGGYVSNSVQTLVKNELRSIIEKAMDKDVK